MVSDSFYLLQASINDILALRSEFQAFLSKPVASDHFAKAADLLHGVDNKEGISDRARKDIDRQLLDQECQVFLINDHVKLNIFFVFTAGQMAALKRAVRMLCATSA